MSDEEPEKETLRAITWNMAAVNNNPFEFWITDPDPTYNKVMQSVQDFISDPSKDVPVHQIFTASMFSDLIQEMDRIGLESLDKVELFWNQDYSNRMAVAGFLRDKAIGTKRLASMPDRITNTINLADGSVCTRPSAINAYCGSLSSLQNWWQQWRDFMFRTTVIIVSSDDSQERCDLVCNLLGPILRSKYPALTVQEQEISVQLQLLCLAILDSVFLHILFKAESTRWEALRNKLCETLIHGKAPKARHIIADAHPDANVVFLQEAAAIFARQFRHDPVLSERFELLVPAGLDGKRDQNSFILLDRRHFDVASVIDVTNQAG